MARRARRFRLFYMASTGFASETPAGHETPEYDESGFKVREPTSRDDYAETLTVGMVRRWLLDESGIIVETPIPTGYLIPAHSS